MRNPLLRLLLAVTVLIAAATVITAIALVVVASLVTLAATAAAGLGVVALVSLVRWRWRRRRRARASVSAPRRAVSGWSASHARFAALRSEYAAYECDALAVLRLPALADVTVPATGRFVDAFAHAQSLDTDQEPPSAHAAQFQQAVDRACRSWQAARDTADRIRLSGLSPAERTSVQRVIKLLTMARDSGNDAERQAAYAKARSELTRLDLTTTIHLPQAAQATLATKAQAPLTAAPS